MLVGRLGHRSRGAFLRPPPRRAAQGTRATSLKQGCSPRTSCSPGLCWLNGCHPPGECCQESRCLCSLATGSSGGGGALLWSPGRVRAALPRGGLAWLLGRCSFALSDAGVFLPRCESALLGLNSVRSTLPMPEQDFGVTASHDSESGRTSVCRERTAFVRTWVED